jgi:hypothetical protein
MVGTDRDDGMEKQDVEKEKRGELADCCELAPVSEGEEETDEDMLAACINIGMQNSRSGIYELVAIPSLDHVACSDTIMDDYLERA